MLGFKYLGIVCGIWAAAVVLSSLPLLGWNSYVYEVRRIGLRYCLTRFPLAAAEIGSRVA
jgi:hypothetical protein